MRQCYWSWQDISKIRYLILGVTKLQWPLQVLLQPVFIDLRNFQVRYQMSARDTVSDLSFYFLEASLLKYSNCPTFLKTLLDQAPKEDFYLIKRSPAVLLREMQDVVKVEWKRTHLWAIHLKTEGTNVLLILYLLEKNATRRDHYFFLGLKV